MSKGIQKIANILNVSTTRAYQLERKGLVTTENEAKIRLIAPPPKGRDRIIEMERDDERYVNVTEAANLMNSTTKTVYRMIQAKKIDAISFHGTYFVLKEAI
jgi:excisionase family DNA binding protein